MDTKHDLTGLKKEMNELKRDLKVTQWLTFVVIVLLLYRHL